MTVARLDKRVGDIEARADDLEARLAGVAARYLEAITPWVVERFEADVAVAVAEAPAVTQELGSEGLRRLRQGLDTLAASAPRLVQQRVGTAGAWPHRWGRDTSRVTAGVFGTEAEPALPPPLESRLRLLLGTSGHLLARHGYQRHVRRNFDRAYLRSDYFPPEYLSRSLEGHQEYQPILAEYGGLCDEYAGLLAERGEAGRARAARAAADLWKHA